MDFYTPSLEVAAAAADLYAETSLRWQCACGWWTFDKVEHNNHRTGGDRSTSDRPAAACQATWSNR